MVTAWLGLVTRTTTVYESDGPSSSPEWVSMFCEARSCIPIFKHNFCIPVICTVCSGSVVVTAYDSESGRPGSNPEWRLIYYEASITAQGLPEPSSLRGSTLGTRAAEHKGYNWGMQIG